MKHKYRSIVFTFALLIFSISSVVAESPLKLIGSVKSKSDKTALIGAAVMEVDANQRVINAVTTDVNGKYSLTISRKDATIEVSYIGYLSFKKTLSGQKELYIEMAEDVKTIDAVVVKGEAVRGNSMMPVSRRDIAVSTSVMATKDLSEMPATSVGEMMQGRISGVDITATSGDPGAGMSIRIRGTSSLNASSEPLIVVDGIPYETKVDATINFATATEEEFGAMLDISPSDIESFEVLKDAAASAVWGSRGANGVLVITTKRGAKGRVTFEYDTKFTTMWEPESISMLNGDQYSMLQLEALFNARGVVSIPQELAYDKSWYNYHNYSQNTDWVKALRRNAFTHEHNFSLMGGGEKARYRLALGYLDQDGTTIGTNLQRLTTRMNVDYDLSTRLRLSGDLSYVNMDNYRTVGIGGTDVRAMGYRKAPNMSIYEMDSNGTQTDKYFAPENTYQGVGYSYYNPVALANDGFNRLRSNRVISKFSLRYYIKPDVLQYMGDVSFDFMDNQTNTFVPQSATGAYWSSSNMNRADERNEEASITQTYNKLIYTPKLGEDHRLTVLGLVSTYAKTNDYMSASVSNTAVSDITIPNSSTVKKSLSSGKNTIRTLSYLANVNYVLFDRYIFAASIRADGDSRFGENSRWGYFPSASVGWRVSSENFMKSVSWVNDLKLKASYGQNGTPPPTTYGFFAKYAAGADYIDMSSIVPTNIQLDNLKWETVTQSNFGVDFSLLKNRLTGNFDVYNKRTKDVIFINTPLPSTSGFTQLEAQNWGTIDNRGWELNLTGEVYRSKDWSVMLSANIAQNKNYIVEIPSGYQTQSYTYDNGQYARRIAVDKSIGSIYGYRFKGVYSTKDDAIVRDKYGNKVYNPTTNDPVYMKPKLGSGSFTEGDAIYEDIDRNGIIDERDIVYLGDSNPLLTGGFGTTIRYKNFSLNAFFHFKYDYDVVNATAMYAENMYNRDNQSTATLSRWRKSGDVTNVPQALYNTGFNWLGSDRFVEDASYMRLKTLTLSYRVNDKKLERYGIRAVKLYLTMYNLFTWTKYTGQDPEIYLPGGNPFAIAQDWSKTPPAKSVTVGLNLSF